MLFYYRLHVNIPSIKVHAYRDVCILLLSPFNTVRRSLSMNSVARLRIKLLKKLSHTDTWTRIPSYTSILVDCLSLVDHR